MTPFKGRNRVTSLYGWRTLFGTRQWHAGQDIVGDDNRNVRAIWDATRCEVALGYNGGRGNYVTLYYSSTLRVLCQHLDDVFVKQGQAVKQGQNIGTMGNTGDSTGAHLHIEVQRFTNNKWSAVPPAMYTEVPNSIGTHAGNDRFDAENPTSTACETVKIGPASKGDKAFFEQLAASLQLPCTVQTVSQTLWTLTIGPASGGDVHTLRTHAQKLALPFETT